MGVSFVIRTLNEEESIAEVIRRINRINKAIKTEVTIVDSGSKDNTALISENLGARVINIRPEEWSWGRSLNSGIAESNYDYIAVISGHCYISSVNFLRNALIHLKKENIAAVYGKQIPIPQVDPFEEYELFQLYPETNRYEMTIREYNHHKLIGISNSCCILKKSVWEKYPFDEKVQSLEDGIWAFLIFQNGYSLIYSSDFSVYHSHPFNIDYIYRKWYWRTYEGIRLVPQKWFLSKKSILFRLLLFLSLLIKQKKEMRLIQQLLTNYKFICYNHIKTYLNIRNLAKLNALKDFYKNSKKTYHSKEIPKNISNLSIKLSTLQNYLLSSAEISGNVPFEMNHTDTGIKNRALQE